MNESVTLPTGKIPKELLQGFCMDLIEELSKLAKFKYDIYLDKNYDGVVEELIHKVVYISDEIVVSSCTLINRRSNIDEFYFYVCPSVLPFVFAVSFIPCSNFLSCYFRVSLSLVSFLCLNFETIYGTAPLA